MTETIIPHRLKAIAAGLKAIALERKYGPLEMIDVMVDICDGRQISEFRGCLLAFTQPAILAAVVHCRCLLEFLGLGLDGKARAPTLNQRSRIRGKDDVGIEHFSGRSGTLQKLQPKGAAAFFVGKGDVAKAWATVIAIANKRLAHSTYDDMLTGTTQYPLLQVAFETIPELVCRALYDQIGSTRPSY